MNGARSSFPLVSIIIPAYNEEKNISKLLYSFANQSYKKFEIIIINDKSTDKTFDLSKKISSKLKLKTKVITPKTHQERGIIRNFGGKLAKGDYLLFIDADMELSQDVLKESVNLIKTDIKIKAIIIAEESIGKGFWAACKALEKRCYTGDDSIEAARFFDKKTFWEIGGWNEKMISGEDWDLTRRVRDKGYKIGRTKSLIFHNEGSLSLFKTINKKFYYATKSETYLSKNKKNIFDVINFIFRPAFIRNWKLLIKDPFHALGMIILKFTELMAGLFGFLYSKL